MTPVIFELTPIAADHVLRNNLTKFDVVGLLDSAMDADNPAGAVEQLGASYRHGGGWHEFKGFKLGAGGDSLVYPGDPPMRAVAKAMLRNERIILFESSWVAVVQLGGTLNVARMD